MSVVASEALAASVTNKDAATAVALGVVAAIVADATGAVVVVVPTTTQSLDTDDEDEKKSLKN